MSSYGWTLTWLLAAINVAAIGLWLMSSRLELVVSNRGLPDARLLATRLGGSLRSAAGWLRSRRPPSLRRWWPASEAPAPALDAWIDEVEREEQIVTHDTGGPESGSEDWWREWADGGGILPPAAGSRRTPGAGTAKSAPETGKSSWHVA